MEEQPYSNNKHLFRIKCEQSQDEFNILGRPCELSAFSFVPPNRMQEPPRRSIFNFKASSNPNNNSLMRANTEYDKMFSIDCSFDHKVHRSDRKHAKLLGLDAWKEEIVKRKPSKSSHEYGKRLIELERDHFAAYKGNYLDPPERKYVRIAKVQSDFYNRNGINDLRASYI